MSSSKVFGGGEGSKHSWLPFSICCWAWRMTWILWSSCAMSQEVRKCVTWPINLLGYIVLCQVLQAWITADYPLKPHKALKVGLVLCVVFVSYNLNWSNEPNWRSKHDNVWLKDTKMILSHLLQFYSSLYICFSVIILQCQTAGEHLFANQGIHHLRC